MQIAPVAGTSDGKWWWRMRGRGVSVIGFIYIVVGLIVAGTFGYLVAWTVPGNIIEGLVAIVFWPVLLFGVDLHALIP